HRDRNVILAKVICVGLAFAGYHLYAGLDRRLGEGTLRRLVMTGRQRGRLGVRSCNPTRSEGDV
ncbi:MAG: hypothetical protein ACREJ8_10045, partial [Candidatus Methylomirabilales bacterium]